MLLCPEQNHTSPTTTLVKTILLFPVTVKSAPSALASSGARSTRHLPAASAVAFPCKSASLTVTTSPGAALPQIGVFALRANTPWSANSAGSFTSPHNASIGNANKLNTRRFNMFKPPFLVFLRERQTQLKIIYHQIQLIQLQRCFLGLLGLLGLLLFLPLLPSPESFLSFHHKPCFIYQNTISLVLADHTNRSLFWFHYFMSVVKIEDFRIDASRGSRPKSSIRIIFGHTLHITS